MALKVKEEKFCLEYLKCGNGSKAATIAGYAEKSARVTASKMLTKPNIQARLEELKTNLAETCGINPVMIVNELKKLAFTNVTDTRSSWVTLKDFRKLPDEVKAAIAEIKYETKTINKKKVSMVKIKMHSKLSAIEELNKMFGYNAPQRHEVTGKNGKPLQQEVKHVVEFSDYADH